MCDAKASSISAKVPLLLDRSPGADKWNHWMYVVGAGVVEHLRRRHARIAPIHLRYFYLDMLSSILLTRSSCFLYVVYGTPKDIEIRREIGIA